MKITRKSVFETNSSSTHSISINSTDFLFDSIKPDKDGNIILRGGQFGWEWKRFDSPLVKANYCAVDAANNPEKTAMLIDVIKKHTGAKNIVFAMITQWDSPDWSYIDHQSDGRANLAFIDEETLKNFIFNRKSYLFTGNDNERPPLNFFDTEEELSEITQYVKLEDSDEIYFIKPEEIESEEKLVEIVLHLFESNMNNKYCDRNKIYYDNDEKREELLFDTDHHLPNNGVDVKNKTLTIRRTKPVYNKGDYVRTDILEEKVLKFEILNR